MDYKWKYKTPSEFSDIYLKSDGTFLTGLWFENSPDEFKHLGNYEIKELDIFKETEKWLDIYFSGKNPTFYPKMQFKNITMFRKDVIDIMRTIPYGNTLTYSDISNIIAKKYNFKQMSSQAVGGAVGWNPIGIIIPCHRVVGKDGSLVGYGGGIDNKNALLKLEGIDVKKFYIPKEGNKL